MSCGWIAQRDTLRAEIISAKQEAGGVQALAQRIETQQKLLMALSARQNALSPLRVLDELTQVIPLDSWVFQFGMFGGVSILAAMRRAQPI